ncbi:MAG: methyltransferase domain-containing protein [Desulfovibrio sp.]|jgi:SAM-dependent methyltransferase|nr:methyltransferase domain-containing protein [Desulfovibrio sp.]
MSHTHWNAPKLLEASGAYQQSCALHAALELDLFTTLNERPMTCQQLATAKASSLRGMHALLCALTALGLLVREGDLYAPCDETRKYLSRASSHYMGHIILHHKSLVSAWDRLAEAVRTGKPTRTSSHRTADKEEREHFLMGMFNVATMQAQTIAAALDMHDVSRLLDLGGGPGTYAITFCQRNPTLEAVIYDLPGTRPIAESVVAKHGLAERVSFQEGDFLKDPITGNYDVVWISQVLHAMGPEESAGLIRKAAGTLNPGGVLYVQEFILDGKDGAPVHPALFGCNMLVGTDTGQVYETEELCRMVADAGAREVDRIEISLPQGCGIIMGCFA